MSPLVKICGITSETDAELAINCGADFIGLIFCASPRQVSPETGARIAKSVGERARVAGIFMNQTIEEVQSISNLAGLELVQLHGSETTDFIDELGLPVIKTVQYDCSPSSEEGGYQFYCGEFKVQNVDSYIKCKSCEYLLLDRKKSSNSARAGVRLDKLWRSIAALNIPRTRLGIAGSLSPEIIGEAISAIDPALVDVCSGVETKDDPRRKSKKLLKELFANAKATSIAV